MRYILPVLISAVCATGASGQVMSTSIGPAPFLRAVTEAPYSAEQTSDVVQTLADGTHITQAFPTMKVYRDSLGRTRTERTLPTGMMAAAEPPTIVEITDPAAGVKYTLDTVNKVAHRQRLQPAPDYRKAAERAASVPAVSNEKQPQRDTEKLGTQTIEGLVAEGTRFTTTYPIGSWGNDRPVSQVSEMWSSPDLKVVVMNKFINPRSGESTMKLTNLSRQEPAASLFQPPADYSIVDEEGSFTLKWGTAQ